MAMPTGPTANSNISAAKFNAFIINPLSDC